MFQSFQLIPTLTARENVQVPLELRGEESAARATELLGPRGARPTGDTTTRRSSPAASSSGWRSPARSARGRACSSPTSPPAISTPRTGATIIDLMVELNRDLGTTLVLVTHDLDLAGRARRTIRLADGAIVADTAA